MLHTNNRILFGNIRNSLFCFSADLVTLTKEIFNGKILFLSRVNVNSRCKTPGTSLPNSKFFTLFISVSKLFVSSDLFRITANSMFESRTNMVNMMKEIRQPRKSQNNDIIPEEYDIT